MHSSNVSIADSVILGAAAAFVGVALLPWGSSDRPGASTVAPVVAALLTAGALAVLALWVAADRYRAVVVIAVASTWTTSGVVLLVQGDTPVGAPALSCVAGACVLVAELVRDGRASTPVTPLTFDQDPPSIDGWETPTSSVNPLTTEEDW